MAFRVFSVTMVSNHFPGYYGTRGSVRRTFGEYSANIRRVYPSVLSALFLNKRENNQVFSICNKNVIKKSVCAHPLPSLLYSFPLCIPFLPTGSGRRVHNEASGSVRRVVSEALYLLALQNNKEYSTTIRRVINEASGSVRRALPSFRMDQSLLFHNCKSSSSNHYA